MMQAMQASRLALGIIMAFFVASANGGETCTVPKLTKCIKDTFNSGNDVSTIVKSDEEQLRKLCRENKLATCVAPFLSNCERGTQLVIDNIKSGLTFICEESNIKASKRHTSTEEEKHRICCWRKYRRQEFVKHSDCFNNTNFETTTTSCTRVYESDVSRASGNQRRLCSITKNYVNCVESPVTKACGQAAGHYIREMTIHFIKPTLDYINCPISGAQKWTGSSSFVVVVAVLLLRFTSLLEE